jgi:hypothetical protein
MPITPLPVLDRTSATFKTDTDVFFGSQLPAFSVQAEAARAAVVADAEQVAASVILADDDRTAAEIAAAQALSRSAAAALSEYNAGLHESQSLASRTGAEQALDSFDDRYLGAKAVAPTLDNDGGALLAGAIYFDTVINGGAWRAWSGAAWVTAPSVVDTAGGTYTPTLAIVQGADLATPLLMQFMRVGNVVTVSGRVAVRTLGTTTAAVIRVSLPFPTTFTSEGACAGTSQIDVFGESVPGLVLADTVNGQALLRFIGAAPSNTPHNLHFTYLIA